MRYEWKDGARSKGLKAEVVGPVLEKLIEKDGTLTAEGVLSEAKKKRSPLHSWFEWDDTEAARQYRLSQARNLIRSITVKVTGSDEDVTVRAFVNLGGPEYEEVNTVLGTADRRQVMLKRAKRELKRVRDQYATLNELARVFAAIDDLAA